MMTDDMRQELRSYLRAKDELAKLYVQLNDVKSKMEPLEKEIEAAIQRYGKSGRTFGVDGVVLQAARPGDYASLTVITVEN